MVAVIDFRHVLVTIASIFFALAVGVVVGAGLAAGTGWAPMTDAAATGSAESGRATDGTTDGAGESGGPEAGPDGLDPARLRARIRRLETVVAYGDAFAAETGARLAGDRLSGRSVVLVAPEGVDGAVLDDVRSSLRSAGGTVTGTVRLSAGWADQRRRRLLEDLAAELADDGVRLPGSPASAYDRAASVLARALVTGEQGAAAPDVAATRILGGFVEARLVSVPGPPPDRAGLAVVVAPPGGRAEADEARAWVAVCRALDRAGRGCVLAGGLGPGPDEPAALTVLRNDRRAAAEVSSVEAVDLPAGRVGLVLALAEQAAEGAGHYGPDGTSDGVLPAEPAAGR